MDSGNSGSMQSSSGGDEEYDSRGDSLSAFLNTPAAALAALSHHHSRLPTTSLHHHHPSPASSSSSPLFDPLSVYFDGLARSPPALPSSTSPLRSLHMPWPRAIGAPDPPSCTDGFGLMASAPPPSDATNTIIPNPMSDSRGLYSGGISISPSPSSSLPTLQHPSSVPPPHNPGPAAAAAAPPRSSKKRSRASRRASTTVLTTDTSNFRAMVQEFTGLPAPPFASSPFPRARFDLLHAAASSVMRSSTMSDASPHYFLRPFAQQLPVFSSGPFSLGGSSSSSASFPPSAITSTVGSTTNVTASTPVNATTIAAIATTSTSMATAISNSNTTSVATASAAISTNTASTSSYQLPSDLGLETQHQSFPNMFSYPSVVPPFSSTKYSSANVSVHLGNKKAVPGARAASTLGAAMADYTIGGGVRHGHADAHLGSVQTPTDEPADMMPSRGGGTAGDDLLRWVEGPAGGNSERGDQGQFRPAGGGSSGSQRGSSCKLNYAGTASSDYHAEKGGENVASARGEGMVESWICSSD